MNSIALANFYDREAVIAKVQAIHELEAASRYEHVEGDARYWQRVLKALEFFPEPLHGAALAVFANVVYVGSAMLDESMRFLARSVADRCEGRGWAVPTDVHVFSTDDHGLAEDFYRLGSNCGWVARLDDGPLRTMRTVSQFLEKVETLPSAPADVVETVRLLLRKKLWVLLTDNTLSGGSVSADFGRLAELRDLLFGPDEARPHVGVLAQLATEEAVKQLGMTVNSDDRWLECGLVFDNSFKVNHPDCMLFAEASTGRQVIELCDWFATVFVPRQLVLGTSAANDLALQPTLQLHREAGGDAQFKYGWRDGGYTIVTHRNCPTNSIPLLWYPMLGSRWESGKEPQEHNLVGANKFYAPPFRRDPSRLKQLRRGDSERLGRIRSGLPEIRRRLSG